jgi:hypothetical protein
VHLCFAALNHAHDHGGIDIILSHQGFFFFISGTGCLTLIIRRCALSSTLAALLHCIPCACLSVERANGVGFLFTAADACAKGECVLLWPPAFLGIICTTATFNVEQARPAAMRMAACVPWPVED